MSILKNLFVKTLLAYHGFGYQDPDAPKEEGYDYQMQLKRDKFDARDHMQMAANLQSAANTPALPLKADMRDKMPPVWNQGNLGSCSANATGAAIQYRRRIESEANDFAPSRLHLYYHSRAIENNIGNDSGASLRDVMKAASSIGVLSEDYWPYIPTHFTKKPSMIIDWLAGKHKTTEYARINQTEAELKATLAQGYPIIFGISVFQSMMSDDVAKTGLVPMPQPGETELGGHAILLVGYDDEKRLFIFRNSWGDAWGDGGYAYLPYDYVLNPDLAFDFWIIKVSQ